MSGVLILFRANEDAKIEASKVTVSRLKPQVAYNCTKWRMGVPSERDIWKNDTLGKSG